MTGSGGVELPGGSYKCHQSLGGRIDCAVGARSAGHTEHKLFSHYTVSMSALKAPYGTWVSPITTEAITKAVSPRQRVSVSILKTKLNFPSRQANGIVDIIVDSITSEVYHLESRPSEGGRCVLVHTVSNRDIVGPKWNIRTGVQEYGGAPAIVHDSVAYFSHFVDGRVYSVRVKSEDEPDAITPGKHSVRIMLKCG